VVFVSLASWLNTLNVQPILILLKNGTFILKRPSAYPGKPVLAKGAQRPASFEGLELSFSWKRRMCGLVPASFSALPFQ
jgi:hypothetical protein